MQNKQKGGDGGLMNNYNRIKSVFPKQVLPVITFKNLKMSLKKRRKCCRYFRWHMGAFDDKENWNSYGHAVTKFPNVLYTHTADMIAARIVGR